MFLASPACWSARSSNKIIMKKRKRIILLLLVIVLSVCFIPMSTSAHSGKTDSAGGHHDTATGEYHYHHGHPAHDHENGVCPYGDYDNSSSYSDYDDTDYSSSDYTYGSQSAQDSQRTRISASQPDSNRVTWQIVIVVALLVIAGIFAHNDKTKLTVAAFVIAAIVVIYGVSTYSLKKETDYYRDKVCFVTDEHSSYYHQYGCPDIRSGLFYVYSIDEAKEAGYEPDPNCCK